MADAFLSGSEEAAAQPHSLVGLRLVVSAIDLEQREHRGIAVYSKALLKALHAAGAEVWLLTEFSAELREVVLRRQSGHTRALLQASKVLDALACGRPSSLPPSLRRRLITRLPLGDAALRRWDSEREFYRQLFPKRHVSCAEQVRLTVHDLVDNPYLQHERLDYLQWVHGLISASDIYLHSMRLAGRREGAPLTIDLHGFDGFITTCPLNIVARGVQFTVQSVHDVIPLEFAQTSDFPAVFLRRLERCGEAARLFMSASTAMKFRCFIRAGANPCEAVVVQPPSLCFPDYPLHLEDPSERLALSVVGHRQGSSFLRPYRYLLFNSSVEPRKNLLFALRAYRESGLQRLGIQFCVTGALKHDACSDQIRRIAQSDSGVILADFVDEALRRELFLNALALVSPSLVEGFGIPVLDAACLGLVVLASPSASHREIQAMHDFRDYVWLCDNLNSSQLAAAMRLVALRERANQLQEPVRRRQRLARHREFRSRLTSAFCRDVSFLIREVMGCQVSPQATQSEAADFTPSRAVPQASGPA
jgi:glycosyltransferase involved in cell wall biosynthesis